MIGAFFEGSVIHYGRLRCILANNLVVIIASLLSLFSSIHIFYTRRFLYGFAVGSFGVNNNLLTELLQVNLKETLSQ